MEPAGEDADHPAGWFFVFERRDRIGAAPGTGGRDACGGWAAAQALTHLSAGRYNIEDILARLARPTPDPKASHEPLRFALLNLSLSAGTVDFDDRAVYKILLLHDVSLRVPFLRVEHGVVAFAPGSATLSPKAKARLDKVAKRWPNVPH